MRHNKIIGWENFLAAVEKVQKYSPWLSRQIAKRAADWPFWYSGTRIREWNEGRVWVELPQSFRNSVEGEICQGHLLLSAELVLRLLLLRYRQEFPFQYQLQGAHLQVHHRVDQAVDIKFALDAAEWERIRLQLARESRHQTEFVFSATLKDGRLAATFTFTAAFTLEKFLPA